MSDNLALLYEKLQSVFGIVVLILVIIEWAALLISRKMERNKEGWINLLSYAIESIPYFLLGRIVIFGSMSYLHNYRLFTLGTEWYVWIAAYVVYDFMFWLVHLLGHKVRLLWCIHGVHHTAKEMKMTVAVRGSFLGFLYNTHTVIWMPLAGFDPFMVFIVESVAQLYGLYEHVNDNFDKIAGKLTFMEKLLITPSVHRVHHACNPIYLDRNFGETLSVWDRLFGTYQSELEDVKPVYGMADDRINSENIWQVQLQLWKDLYYDLAKAPRLSDKVRYIFIYPGWNHLNGGKKADSYRHEALSKYKMRKKMREIDKLPMEV